MVAVDPTGLLAPVRLMPMQTYADGGLRRIAGRTPMQHPDVPQHTTHPGGDPVCDRTPIRTKWVPEAIPSAAGPP